MEKETTFLPPKFLKEHKPFKDLIRHHNREENEYLRESIKKDGIREPISIWVNSENEKLIVDGYHRFGVAIDLDLEYVKVVFMSFPSENAVKIWMIKNQLGRRNLSDAERIEMSLQLTEFKKRGEKSIKDRSAKGKSLNLDNQQTSTSNSPKTDSLQAVAETANVSRAQVAKYKKIAETDERLKQEILNGEKSIHKAHQELKEKYKNKFNFGKKAIPKKETPTSDKTPNKPKPKTTKKKVTFECSEEEYNHLDLHRKMGNHKDFASLVMYWAKRYGLEE